MFRLTSLVTGLLVVCGCGDATRSTDTNNTPDGRVLKLFGGKTGWKPVAQPIRVEAYRVEADSHRESPDAGQESDDRPKFAGFPVIAGPTEVNLKTAQILAKHLADPDAYVWDFAKGCIFDPGVGIRFVGAEATTEILLCFSCDELQISHGGKTVGHEDTDAIRTPLVNAVKEMFPGDKIIQGLKTAEELKQAAEEEERKRSEQIRQWSRLMPESVVQALRTGGPAAFKRVCASKLPETNKQIQALLHFAGGPNGSWTEYAGIESSVGSCLKNYSVEQLSGPVREALLGKNRLSRRGAARFWESWRSPLSDWTPKDSPQLHSICLTVMQEARYYPTRQTAQQRLVSWAAELPPDEVESRLRAGLYDAHPSVRRSAMLAAGEIGKKFAIPYLLNQLNGEAIDTKSLPDVPIKETSDVSSGFDDVAAKRTEAEVAALSLGLLGHTEAAALIEKKQPPSPMYEVALALLGQLDRIKLDHFQLSEPNKELQLAAVEAVVRAKGRRGLDFVTSYEQATHWWEEEYVVKQVTTMLIAEQAPGEDQLKTCSDLEQFALWYAKHGAKYLQRFAKAK